VREPISGNGVSNIDLPPNEGEGVLMPISAGESPAVFIAGIVAAVIAIIAIIN
jgi:hypothetical protein